MRSSAAKPRVRKNPEDRRLEILDTASQLALRMGLEKVTMKLVAEHLEVRPGLISHYFRTIDELLCAAFERAATREREALFEGQGEELKGLAALCAFLRQATAPDFSDLGKLWLDARHQSRYRAALREVVIAQELLTNQQLSTCIEQALEMGEISGIDPEQAATEILIVVDGAGSYVNTSSEEATAALAGVTWRMSERALGLEAGSLNAG
ncbi:TetR/AcrR family transcriptional regulator [Glutamicibacter uratoxydans]|nr:TetR/AcrR family transcriptional regulator [Glutamicibacter uratoxydans]